FTYVSAGFYELIRTFSSSRAEKRNQTAYIIAASLIGFACGSTQFFPVFGINVFPAGMFIFPLYAVLAAYAVVFHRLLDIKVAIRKSLIYSIIVFIFSAFYALMVLLFMGLMQKIAGLNYFVSAASTIAVFALLFDPLKNYVQKTVDRLFFRDSYDAQRALNDFSKAAVSIISLDELLDIALAALCGAWKIKDVIIALKNGKEGRAVVKRRKGFEKAGDGLEAPLVVPIKEKDGISGYIAIGEKPMKGMWNGQDLEIFAVICGQIGFAVEKERLYLENFDAQRKLMQNEKFAAIGSISASMAHEIKNPLTALKGMVSVLSENAGAPEFLSKFSEISIRQLDRINSTVENLLRLS
ncbi:MAG: histidine kinase dimerization/phospho-acceptor domain-containing protein, partial [Candidatus Margulisiibacteriota bacterium]